MEKEVLYTPSLIRSRRLRREHIPMATDQFAAFKFKNLLEIVADYSSRQTLVFVDNMRETTNNANCDELKG